MRVLIRGAGIAAYCCRHLLAQAGIEVCLEPERKTAVPAILINHVDRYLIEHVFGRTDLFDGFTQIRSRRVAWTASETPAVTPYPAVLAPEQALRERMLGGVGPENRHFDDPDWIIDAHRAPHAEEHAFGTQVASAAPVRLGRECDPSMCCIEAEESGWRLLAPQDHGNGWLFSVGELCGPLPKNTLIGSLVQHTEPAAAQFLSHPRIAWPLWGEGWLACGSAAVGFDPVSGSGAGNAVRHAILACAVLRAIARGLAPQDVCGHYAARTLTAFHDHLQACRQSYSSGRRGPWWDLQLEWIERGLLWSSGRSEYGQHLRYGIQGFDLVPPVA